ncbi:MAG: hypothetical protein EXR51_04760 [Dehalococcoidia bacterium]|nr:hypothetical protein [Dehalococcoidia bacterium]
MPIERRELERLLLHLGFTQTEGDHRFFELMLNSRRVVRTKFSRGTGYRTIGEDGVSTMAGNLRISRAFLYQLVRGEKDRDDYLNELRRKGLL